ncbi:acid proteinase [Penicillium bovifimosum]|uniref:Acid proteinase n=1 Tax=Penicillium bovifimosum TaxID=126998 RepID=A0A9W9GHD0_9EURO|nr:acid proteinase [Penicillium bovifimosum]KAJ5120465.1 acid proteinase [Penicillium bovifimosum]
MRWITRICLLSGVVPALAEFPFSDSTVAKNDLASTNWCGSIQAASDGERFKSVSSTIVVPTVTGPMNAEYSAYAWIGIDGWDGLDNLFQAGLDIQGIESDDGSYYPQFRGYYEWYPEDAQFFSTDELPLSSGDTLYVNITAHSATTGTIYLENETQGKSKSFDFDEPSYPLRGRYAEWIVEEFSDVTLPAFGSITFDSNLAITSHGTSFDGSSASLIQADTGLKASRASGGAVSVSVV